MSCSLGQRTLSHIWVYRLNLWPTGLPHLDLAEVLWPSSEPRHTGQRAGTPEAEMERSPPGSWQSNVNATSHLQEEIERMLPVVKTKTKIEVFPFFALFLCDDQDKKK